MNKTSIEWTDSTWNPIRGCSRVSEGCRNCYAENVAKRFSGPGLAFEGLVQLGADGKGLAKWNGQIRFVEDRLLDPLRWKRPRRIFVNSVSDLFHANVTNEMLDKIFAVMLLCPQHTFQVLTKRPERMREYVEKMSSRWVLRLSVAINEYQAMHEAADLPDRPGPAWPLPNVWLGVSVENQKAADERIPLLLQTPAAVRFLSVEPLLGPVMLPRKVHLSRSIRGDFPIGHHLIAMSGYHTALSNPLGALSIPMKDGQLLGIKPDEFEDCGTEIDWAICGGESGPGARPMHPDWARSLRDQCAAAGVPFFFKQHGEWSEVNGDRPVTQHDVEVEPLPNQTGNVFVSIDGHVIKAVEEMHDDVAYRWMSRLGKKAAGRLLDGREWNEMPAVRA